MKRYLEQLNENQKEAVTSSFKYIRVIAGAGSGKTKVLTSRLAYLIDDGVEENKILAITFTNKAAKEMKIRVEKLMESEQIKSTISTYHSFCARFLRQEISHIGYTHNFVILDEEDQESIIKDLKKDIDIEKILKPKKIADYISRQKCDRVSPESLKDRYEEGSEYYIKSKVYYLYEQYLKDNNYLDFDDLIIKTVDILKEFKEIRNKWSSKFDYILIDEFQDTNNEEYTLIKLLTKKDTSLFVVGDPDQTIYTWRGANPNIIFDYTIDFENVKDYILNLNYRSTQSILDASNSLIGNNKKRVKKDLIANKENGEKPLYYNSEEVYEESDYIAKNIYDDVNKFKKYNYKDYAILYRSNYYSANLEKSLMKLCIPYRIFGSVKFYERKEIKDALSYLRLILNNDDILAFSRIINVPRRGVGPKKLESIMAGAKENNISPFEYIEKTESDEAILGSFVKLINDFREKIKLENKPNFGKILKELLDESGYIDTIDRVDEEDRIENLNELSDILFQYQIDNNGISLDQIITEITLYSAQDDINEGDYVSLMTAHTAKGLEFPVVYIAGLSDGVFPNARSIMGFDGREREDELEEERRLLYVAMTRAQEKLFLTSNNGYSFTTSQNLTESRFIREIEDNITRFFKKIRNQFTFVDQPIRSRKNEEIIQSEVSKISDDDYNPGNMVIHKAFGEGIILEVSDVNLKVAFKNPEVGVKLISRKFPGISKKV